MTDEGDLDDALPAAQLLSSLRGEYASIAVRDPEPLLQRTRREWGGDTDLWLFGYASLIWRPDFPHAEQRLARVHGWHRTLRMRSRVNRGSATEPGLVFALMSGGSTRGIVYRLPRRCVDNELDRLWAREMPTGVYEPRWLACDTDGGAVRALAFTLARHSPNYTGAIDDASMLHILAHARGRFGSTLEYVLETAKALRQRGIADHELDRLVSLAHRHGLTPVTAVSTTAE